MTTLDEARNKLALANRILAHEGVLDGFGHVSMRHPADPDRYLLARSRSPELIEPSDILEFTLDSQPLVPPTGFLYGERVIHGCIYQARPDVHAVCHHHSRAVMPFCISGVPLQPVDHLGATMGAVIPFWDQRDEFGDTDLIVAKPEEGQSLARALGRELGCADAATRRDRGGHFDGRDGVSLRVFLPQCGDATRGASARRHQQPDAGRNPEGGRVQPGASPHRPGVGILDDPAAEGRSGVIRRPVSGRLRIDV